MSRFTRHEYDTGDWSLDLPLITISGNGGIRDERWFRLRLFVGPCSFRGRDLSFLCIEIGESVYEGDDRKWPRCSVIR